jgi:hypothetical protein
MLKFTVKCRPFLPVACGYESLRLVIKKSRQKITNDCLMLSDGGVKLQLIEKCARPQSVNKNFCFKFFMGCAGVKINF